METLVEIEIFNNLNERSKQIKTGCFIFIKYQSGKWDHSNFKAKTGNRSEVG